MKSRPGMWWRAMPRPRAAVWLALSLAIGVGSTTHALEVVLAGGEHDVSKDSDHTPFEGGFTLRFTGTEIWHSKHGMTLVPALGGIVTEDDAYYGWVGGAMFIPLGQNWGLVPELGAGAYERGDGKNLGGTLEFRSGLEATYRASDSFRVGLGFYHLSNAGIHEVNPGVNSFVLTVGFHPKPRSGVWNTAGPAGR